MSLTEEELKEKMEEEKTGMDDIEIRFDEMTTLEWRQFITVFEGKQTWLEAALTYNLSSDILNQFLKPRQPGTSARTMDTNIFAPKGLGKSYLMLTLKGKHHSYFEEQFDWDVWFMSPTQFLMYSEKANEAEISNKFLAIDEPRIKERGEGSGALHDRFMNTRATIRPRRSVIVQASERYVSTNPNLVLKPVHLDEPRGSLMSLVLSPDMIHCYGSLYSGTPDKDVAKEYDKRRLVFEKQVRTDKSEIMQYWEPFILQLVEDYDYVTKQIQIEQYVIDKNEWATDKKNHNKPSMPSFKSPKADELSDKRIIMDARKEKKLSMPDYEFVAGLVKDYVKEVRDKQKSSE